MDIWKRLRVELLLLHIEKLAEVEQTFDYSPGHFPVEVSFQDETPEPTQDMVEAFSLSSGLGMSRDPPRGSWEKLAGKQDGMHFLVKDAATVNRTGISRTCGSSF